MENHALLYYIVGQTYIDSVPVPFYPLCCVTDADGYRPSCLLSTKLDVDDRRAVDNALTLEQLRLVAEMSMITEPWIMHLR